MPQPIDFPTVFRELQAGYPSAESTRSAFDAILDGVWAPTQIAAFLAGLRIRGENAATVSAAARSMRGNMVAVEHGLPSVLDTCGTGGDGSGTVNLSTGAAIIAAACGVTVAKHGNRAISSKAGSADVIEALGIPTDLPTATAAPLLKEAGIAFLMAPLYHPAMRFAAPIRRELGVRTLFNVLGPLANPARVTHQLLGAFDDALRPILAETLKELGTQRAWVVRGIDGMDEVSPYGPTRVTELSDGKLREFEVTPESFGLSLSPAGAALGGDATHNAAIILEVLSGAPHPAREAFIVNAAAALVVARGTELRQAAEEARAAIDEGRALETLNRWKSLAVTAGGH